MKKSMENFIFCAVMLLLLWIMFTFSSSTVLNTQESKNQSLWRPIKLSIAYVYCCWHSKKNLYPPPILKHGIKNAKDITIPMVTKDAKSNCALLTLFYVVLKLSGSYVVISKESHLGCCRGCILDTPVT